MRLLLIILLLPLLCAGDWSDVLIKAIDHIAKLLEKDNNKKGESLKKKIIVEPSHVPHGKLQKPKPVPIETPSPPPPPLPAPLMPLPLPLPSMPPPPTPPKEEHGHPEIDFRPRPPPPPPPPEEEASHSTQAPIESEVEKGEDLEKPRCTVTLFDDWHFNRPEEGGEHFHSNAKLILAESEDDLGDLSNAASSIRLSLCQDQVVTFSSNGKVLPLILSGNAEIEFLGHYNDLIDAVHIRDKTSEEDERSEEEVVEDADAREESLRLLRIDLAAHTMYVIDQNQLVSQDDVIAVGNVLLQLVQENRRMRNPMTPENEALLRRHISIRLLAQATQDIIDHLRSQAYGLNNVAYRAAKQAVIAVADEYAVKLIQPKILRE